MSHLCFLPCLESIGLSVQEKKQKIDFQDGRHGSHLGFPIGTILAIFDLQVTPMLPTMFGFNWLLGSGEETKNRFSRWLPWHLTSCSGELIKEYKEQEGHDGPLTLT